MEYQKDDGKMTAQTVFINLRMVLDTVFTRDHIFDTRFYGTVITLFFLGGMYFLAMT